MAEQGKDRGELEKEADRRDEHRYSYLHQRFADDSPKDLERAEAYRAPLRSTETRWEQLSRPSVTERARVLRRQAWTREPYTAAEVMTRSPRSLRREHTVREAARLLKEANCGIVPMVDDHGRLEGVVTDRDLVLRVLASDDASADTELSEVMTREVVAVRPDETVHDVLALMGARQIRRVPVVDADNRLVGIISMSDVATRAQYDIELEHALERISSRSTFWNRIFGW
jgi:CBS domain-containing protein